MSVDVGAGMIFIPGTESGAQSNYIGQNDATVNLSISTAPGTGNSRIDLIVAKVQDTVYSGGVNSWSLAVVTGTASASPSAPAAPNNSIILAQIAVGANVTSIVNANITDKRYYAAALGGLIPIVSLTERAALITYTGMPIYRLDTNRVEVYDGTNWRPIGARPQGATVATSQTTASTTYTDLGTVGPTVSLETGTTALVTISSLCAAGSAGNAAFMSFAISGATTVAANDAQAMSNPTTSGWAFGITFLVTGLTPGTNVFTAKYRIPAGAAATWVNRNITVTPV
jgi:hypothetical protein